MRDKTKLSSQSQSLPLPPFPSLLPPPTALLVWLFLDIFLFFFKIFNFSDLSDPQGTISLKPGSFTLLLYCP